MCVKRSLLLLFAVISVTADIYAQTDQQNDSWPYLISAINITGIEKTSPEFILGELTFAAGEVLTLEKLREEMLKSRINLVNTALFLNHEISLRYELADRSTVVVHINVAERWYFWPEPVLQNAERNFNLWLADPGLEKINWGVNLIQDNVLGSNERLNLVLRFGYDEKYEIAWSDPSILNSPELGLKTGLGFSGNHEVAYMTGGNRLKFIRSDEYIMTGYYGFAQISHRPSFHILDNFQVMVKYFTIHDTLLLLNPQFAPASSGRFLFADLSYFLKIDYRDHKAYPLEGLYGDIEIRQTGISLDKTRYNSFTSATSNFRFYDRIRKGFFFGTGITGMVSSVRQHPFIFRQGLGYGRVFVRGYEYEVMHGHAFFLIKNNIKYALVSQRPLKLAFMPHEKFRNASLALYVNLFADAGYVFGSEDNGNDLVNSALASAGLGLDIVTYYDKVMRIEATINNKGTSGIYIHFIAPI